jgi:uncharacterized membrane protein
VTLDLPVAQVFAFWDDLANFPKFMHHVPDVRPTRDPRRWHWTVGAVGPTAPIEFDAIVTERIPNLDEDLVRMKIALETGRRAHGAAVKGAEG